MTSLRFIHRLLSNDTGFATVYLGVGMMALVGAAGLAVDVGAWYRAMRMAQTAADAAAYAGALDLGRQGLNATADTNSMRAAANSAAMRNGTTLAVTLHHPPTAGIEFNDPQSVEVIVAEPAPMIFTSALLGSTPTVRARAVAKAVVADACLYALNPAAAGALTISGSSNVQLGCGVVVNSTHEQAALDQNGTSCISATAITIAGGYDGNCVTPDPEVYTEASRRPATHCGRFSGTRRERPRSKRQSSCPSCSSSRSVDSRSAAPCRCRRPSGMRSRKPPATPPCRYASGAAATSSDLEAMAAGLVDLPGDSVTVAASFDPDNRPGSAVTISIDHLYTPMLSLIFGPAGFTLSSTSTLTIIR